MSTRSRHHRRGGFYAFLLLRLSGIALAVFLPLHFLALGLAMEDAKTFEGFLVYTDMPWVKAAEWVLLSLTTIHLVFGIRVLMIEFLEWRGPRMGWVGAGIGAAAAVGAAFVFAVA